MLPYTSGKKALQTFYKLCKAFFYVCQIKFFATALNHMKNRVASNKILWKASLTK